MGLFLPTDRTSQPQQVVGINWSNPITNGLYQVIIPSQSIKWVNRSPVDISGVSRSITRKGVALNFAGSQEVVIEQSQPKLIHGSLQSSASFVNKTILRSITPDITLQGDSSGNWIYWDGAVNRVTAQPIRSSVFTINFLSALELYIDGVYISDFSGSTTAPQIDRIGRTASLGLTGNLEYLFFFSKAKTRSEIKSLSDNPWQIIYVPTRRLFAVPSFNSIAAGTGVTTGAGTGSSLFSSIGSGVAVATGSAIGNSLFNGVAAGTSVATGTGVGLSAFNGVAQGTAIANGSSAGASLFSGIGAGTSVATGSCVGQGGATGTGVVSGNSVSAGLIFGSSFAQAVASGFAVVNGSCIGSSLFRGSISGSGIATGGFTGSYTSAGSATATGGSVATSAVVGSSKFNAAVSGLSVGTGVFFGASLSSVYATMSGNSVATGYFNSSFTELTTLSTGNYVAESLSRSYNVESLTRKI